MGVLCLVPSSRIIVMTGRPADFDGSGTRGILNFLCGSAFAEAGVFLLREFMFESLCFSWEARRSYNVPYLCVKLSDFDLLLRGFLLIRNVDTLLCTCQHVSGNHPILSTSC